MLHDDLLFANVGRAFAIERHTTEKRIRKTRTEMAYGLTDFFPESASPERLPTFNRNHWGIEAHCHKRIGYACFSNAGDRPETYAKTCRPCAPRVSRSIDKRAWLRDGVPVRHAGAFWEKALPGAERTRQCGQSSVTLRRATYPPAMPYKQLFCSLVLAVAFAIGLAGQALAERNALDEYVAEPDPSYSYARVDTRIREGYTIFVLWMASQEWREPNEVDRVSWIHEVLISVPWVTHSGNQHSAFLVVNGGSNSAPPTTENDELLGLLSVVTGSVVAMVSQVPNQPLRFSDESDSRIEDALLAYGMDKYLRTGDPEWLVHFPMTKAVVRAMDTVQAFAAGNNGWPDAPRIDDFLIMGGSKRGWATWLAAAVEAEKGGVSRVRAIAPISIDLLNLDEQFERHWEAYGFYAPAVQDYVEFSLPCRVNTAAGQSMLDLIDPYAYRDRLTMPKLVLNSAGDQFFLPDSSQLYFEDLPNPKWLRYTPNTDHSQGQDLLGIVLPTLSWFSEILDEGLSTKFTWTLEPDGSIRVKTFAQPKRVRLWQAANPTARDFRLESIGAAWTSSNLEDTGNGVYIGYVAPPPEGWIAFTVELTFPGSTIIPTPLETDQVFTTDVRVTPDTLPYQGTSCFCSACLPNRGGWRSTLEQ